MQRITLTGVGAVALLAVIGCGGEEPGGGGTLPEEAAPQAEEASPTTTAGDAEVYVLNRYGDENGFDDRRPTEYVATEFTTFSDMEWREWSDGRARGEGGLLGTWCMDQECQNDPYDVEVELGDPVEADGTRYFSTYTITEYDDDMTDEVRRALEGADDGRLEHPAAR
ncbi:hypothetical protein [Nocardiopsis lambiniae]|uniref:Lipoprotein n=1 Tax=Nocardiopsis lambiniae TaxID=3075539 RepID=A0ABU2MF82_9ACTN|nr:hypothetical protein [Nocardiopsis sp. DSM 44743]MDT0331367.1 hypothetical protein [Nocardiopsis sp. DSM 44743]